MAVEPQFLPALDFFEAELDCEYTFHSWTSTHILK